MQKKLYKFVFKILVLAIIVSKKISGTEVTCRDPILGHRGESTKYVVVSSPGLGGGLGNGLSFYPAAYFYAVLTGREIVIHDDGLIGELCSIIQCGFPFLSEMTAVYPKILSDETLRDGKSMKAYDMIEQFKGKFEVENRIVYPLGFQFKSDWWLWMNGTTECVQKITGCNWGDVYCSQYYAYQVLVKGPYRSGITSKEEGRITGIPSNIKHGIMSLPRVFAPRLDVSCHLRAQFKHFESNTNHNDSNYKHEVQTYLNSSGVHQIFQLLEEKIVLELSTLGLYRTAEEPAYVYVAADNEDVKDAFIYRLESSHPIKVMRIETSGIYHTKAIVGKKTEAAIQGLFDVIFDWYALSLSRLIIAWRKDTGMRSSFVQSAACTAFNVSTWYLVPKHGRLVWQT